VKILVTAFVFALLLCGAVSAENTTTGGESGSIVDSGSNLTHAPVIESPEVREGNSSEKSQIVISGSVADCITKLAFPNVTVTAKNNNTTLATAKTGSDGRYNLSFVSVDRVFNVTASYPGHIPSSKEVTVSPNPSNTTLHGTADFELGKPRVLFLFRSNINPVFATAAENSGFFENNYGVLRLERSIPDDFTRYNLIFMDFISPGIPNTERFFNSIREAIRNNIPVVVTSTLMGVPEGVIVADGHREHGVIRRYWLNLNYANARELLKYLGNTFLGLNLGEPRLFPVIQAGIYHPDATQSFDSLDSYLKWYGPIEGKKTVGIMFRHGWYLRRDILSVDALIRNFENKGIRVIPHFLHGDVRANIDRFFMKDGRPAVDAVVVHWLGAWARRCPHEAVMADLKRLNVPIIKGLLTITPYKEWSNATWGIPAFTLAGGVAAGERDGMIEPILIATTDQDPRQVHLPVETTTWTPIDRQINWLVDRTIAWINLRRTPNPEKRVAIIYWEGGCVKDVGKDIGASAAHLDVYASLPKLLEALKNDGYYLGDRPLPNATELANLIRNQGRNIGVWAPGELENLVRNYPVVQVPLAEYMKWFNTLNETKRKEVIDMWGEPPGRIMVHGNNIVLPIIRFGNVILAPEPSRGIIQDRRALYHEEPIPPTHQYLAFYFWLQRGFNASAAIHFGKKGTVGMLPGRCGPGLDRDRCWPAIVSGNIPVIYPFTVDGVESMLPKRRQGAVMISHLTPPITISGLHGDLAELRGKISGYIRTIDEEVKKEYRRSIIRLVRDLKLYEDLNINMDNVLNDFESFLGTIRQYLRDIESRFIPYGLHVFGEPLRDKRLTHTVQSLLGFEFRSYMENNELSDENIQKLLRKVILEGISPEDAQRTVFGNVSANMTRYLNLALNYRAKINNATLEITRTLAALRGGYIPPGRIGDPIIDPYVLPTGRNLATFDPREVPSEEAWRVGKRLARDTLERYKKETGDYPRQIAFMLLASQTGQDMGVMEATILYLLGVRPVADARVRNRIVGVRLIENLTRPRINVVMTTSSLYHSMYRCRLDLLNEAVRLAANANDTLPNYVRERSEAIYRALIGKGYSEEKARRLSMLRAFTMDIGNHRNPLMEAVQMSGTWNNERELADLYVGTFGNLHTGADNITIHSPDLYRLNLDGTNITMFRLTSRIPILFCCPFGFIGGLSLTVRSITGNDPRVWMMNLQNPGNPRIESVSESLWRDLRTKYLNPKWISEIQKHGRAGAGQMVNFVNALFGWDVSSPDSVTNTMWNKVHDVYIRDSLNLGLRAWFNEHNPYAFQSISGRMIEAYRKGYWQTDSETIRELANYLAGSVSQHGASCGSTVCGNNVLMEWIKAKQFINPNVLAQFNTQMYQTTQNPMFAPGPGVGAEAPGGAEGVGVGAPRVGAEAPGGAEGEGEGVPRTPGAEGATPAPRAGVEGATLGMEAPEGRAYEVAKATPPGGIPTGTPIWPVAGVILVISLVILGYFKESILGFLLRK
jgi:cobaltochelatase CobN